MFLPFVNLHQEHYWWPDADGSGDCMIFGRKFGVRGSVVQYYLWLQIMSGWLLSAIFVAGVDGLMRSVSDLPGAARKHGTNPHGTSAKIIGCAILSVLKLPTSRRSIRFQRPEASTR